MNEHSPPPSILATVCTPRWLAANLERLQQCFPEEWTPMIELNAYVVGERLRALGVDWQGDDELNGVLAVLQRVGIMRMAIGRPRYGLTNVDLVKRGALIVNGESR